MDAFAIDGDSAAALFKLRLYRGEGMALLGMNWRHGRPPHDFVGFAIEYREPDGDRYYALKNRLGFPTPAGGADPNALSTRLSPIQKFRWVHFPRNASLSGEFRYRVTPVFMNDRDELSYGDSQEAAVALQGETCPGVLNVAFTRGFVSSQAFVDRYASTGSIATLLPARADDGLTFHPTHPKEEEALRWMGFEARQVILDVLDEAIADAGAQVRMVAYDLNEPEIVSRLARLGERLRIVIDNSGSHGHKTSAEAQAADRLAASAGADHVLRQHMGKLQHNKTIVVDGPAARAVVCGSTNFSWRGLYVQSNNAIVFRHPNAVSAFTTAFETYWGGTAASFEASRSARWTRLDVPGVNVKLTFSPHDPTHGTLEGIADDIARHARSSLFYSLAFLYQTPGPILDAIKSVTDNGRCFVYGISDRKVGGLDLQKPSGNVAPVYPSALSKGVPAPFSAEPVGGGGVRLHHKFVVIDFDRPTARVYMGSHNFSRVADGQNGENLLLIRDRRVAIAYTIEALRIFDHYHFRVNSGAAGSERRSLTLSRPPRKDGEEPWWLEDYTDPVKIRDRKLFSGS